MWWLSPPPWCLFLCWPLSAIPTKHSCTFCRTASLLWRLGFRRSIPIFPTRSRKGTHKGPVTYSRYSELQKECRRSQNVNLTFLNPQPYPWNLWWKKYLETRLDLKNHKPYRPKKLQLTLALLQYPSSSSPSGHELNFKKWLRIINSCKCMKGLWDALTPYGTTVYSSEVFLFLCFVRNNSLMNENVVRGLRTTSSFRVGYLFIKIQKSCQI